jgi:hypothetical protein
MIFYKIYRIRQIVGVYDSSLQKMKLDVIENENRAKLIEYLKKASEKRKVFHRGEIKREVRKKVVT